MNNYNDSNQYYNNLMSWLEETIFLLDLIKDTLEPAGPDSELSKSERRERWKRAIRFMRPYEARPNLVLRPIKDARKCYRLFANPVNPKTDKRYRIARMQPSQVAVESVDFAELG